jgi:hypothetical protein
MTVPATPDGRLPALVRLCVLCEVTESVNRNLTCDLVVKLFDYAVRKGLSDPMLARKQSVHLRQFEQRKCDFIQQPGVLLKNRMRVDSEHLIRPQVVKLQRFTGEPFALCFLPLPC